MILSFFVAQCKCCGRVIVTLTLLLFARVATPVLLSPTLARCTYMAIMCGYNIIATHPSIMIGNIK